MNTVELDELKTVQVCIVSIKMSVGCVSTDSSSNEQRYINISESPYSMMI